jgi:signal transduction histidine kinase
MVKMNYNGNPAISRPASLPIRFALGVIVIVALSLVLFYSLMRPASTDLGLMALFLSVTAIVSILAGYGAYRLGWMNRSPALSWTLLGGYALSSLLTFLNVWITANLMFTDEHDLQLATVLLAYASGIAMALGYFLANTLTYRIRQLDLAAMAIARGDLKTRTRVQGKDEIAALGETFNQMAERLQTADEQQRQLDHLRRDLIAWVSHDLQTPLASIRAIIEALADDMIEDPQTQQRYLRTAQREIAALSILIDDLFQMAQLDAGGLPLECEHNALSDLVSDTLETFSEMAARQGVLLEGSVADGVDPVWMDGPRIGRVLNNLVANALRHVQPGGRVSVSAKPVAEGVQIEVTDDGPGIAPEDLPNIFERFYRGEKSRNRATGGAGLGLAIARGIVEAHKGQIGVESSPNQHTRFYFILPSQGSTKML